MNLILKIPISWATVLQIAKSLNQKNSEHPVHHKRRGLTPGLPLGPCTEAVFHLASAKESKKNLKSIKGVRVFKLREEEKSAVRLTSIFGVGISSVSPAALTTLSLASASAAAASPATAGPV